MLITSNKTGKTKSGKVKEERRTMEEKDGEEKKDQEIKRWTKDQEKDGEEPGGGIYSYTVDKNNLRLSAVLLA